MQWDRFVQSADPQVRKSAQRVRFDLIVDPVDASTALGGELNSEQGLVLSMSSKTRTLDPDVKIGSEVKRLTELDGEYAAQREAYIASKKGERRYVVTLAFCLRHIDQTSCSLTGIESDYPHNRAGYEAQKIVHFTFVMACMGVFSFVPMYVE